MNKPAPIPTAKDKILFTPGPLTTSLKVKQAMLRDAGSWHFEFNAIVSAIRRRLLLLAELRPEEGWECIPLQGSGSFCVEAVLATCIPPRGKLLVLANGAYGERAVDMARHLRIDHTVLRTPEDTVPDLDALVRSLEQDRSISHVLVVHCETTTGILNSIEKIGATVKQHGRRFIVDAMSSFGAIPIDFAASGIDFLVSSANKCIEGVPGFAFAFCRRADMLATEGWARSLTLNLLDQLKGFDRNGQFRYTPPTHALLAFEQALNELDLEGGVAARGARYRRNHEVLLDGMRSIGFRPYLPPAVQSCIITSFHYPVDPRFSYDEFYQRLSGKGYLIYPGKITRADTFRIGSIGRIFEADIRALLAAIREALDEMEVSLSPGSVRRR